LDYLNVYYQSVLNLTSASALEDPVKLDGIVMNERSALKSKIKKVIDNVWFGKLILAIYFQDHQTLEGCLQHLSFGRSNGVDGCMLWVSTLLWCEGLGGILLYRSQKKRKYVLLARRRIKQLTLWTRRGSVNCYHSLLHLEAEIAILNRQPMLGIKDKFDTSISAARRAGWNNQAAFVNERAALFFQREQLDHERASTYMMISYQLYESWGAAAKTMTMIRDHSDLLSNILPVVNESLSKAPNLGTSHVGRVRHTSLSTKLHQGLHLFSDNSNNSSECMSSWQINSSSNRK
jgi:hypothetical protein